MSILIKGMEIPKSCSECFMKFCDGRKTVVHFTVERGDNCSLVPVPPHGRLIDADEFLKRAIGTKCFRGDYALMLEELVGESTTIIPAEGSER